MPTRLLAATIAALFFTSPAFSANLDDPAPKMSALSCYVGGAVGHTVHDAKSTTSADVALGNLVTLTVDGMSADGVDLTVGGGCDVKMGRIVLGAFADWTWANDQEWTANLSAFNNAFAAPGSLEFEDRWSIGGRLGVTVGSAMLYGLIAYVEQQTSDLVLTSTAGNLTVSVPDMEGVQYGGGVEINSASLGPIVIFAEYRYTDWDDVNFNVFSGGGLSVDQRLETESHSVMVGGRVKLGDLVK